MYIYEYQHLDILDFIRPVNDITDKNLQVDLKKIEEIKQLFRDKGWEGDGELGLIWLPPFLWDEGDTIGHFAWHVKQLNNGTSFIASEVRLIFGCLSEHNYDRSLFPTIETITVDIQNDLQYDIRELRDHLQYLSTTNEDAIIGIKQSLLKATHSNILVLLEDYIEQLFIHLIDEKYINYNHNIILNRMNCKLKNIDREETFKGMLYIEKMRNVILVFLSSMYNSFKRNSFKEKLTIINKALGIDEISIVNSIMTHKVLRNCVQHNHSVITKDKVDKCDIKSINNVIGEFKFGDTVEFRLETVMDLNDIALKYTQIVKNNFSKITGV